ncbi:TPA: hypothetical protein RQN22_001833 [Aeromonas dhakensis]|nr:hypothetical protein [Aeromonas dhakensis]
MKSEDFIGTKFDTPKGGVLTVISMMKRIDNRVYYKVHCSECAKDPELFGNGIFETCKHSLTRGSFPCGCSKRAKWSPEQKAIRAKRGIKRVVKSNVKKSKSMAYASYETRVTKLLDVMNK